MVFFSMFDVPLYGRHARFFGVLDGKKEKLLRDVEGRNVPLAAFPSDTVWADFRSVTRGQQKRWREGGNSLSKHSRCPHDITQEGKWDRIREHWSSCLLSAPIT